MKTQTLPSCLPPGSWGDSLWADQKPEGKEGHCCGPCRSASRRGAGWWKEIKPKGQIEDVWFSFTNLYFKHTHTHIHTHTHTHTHSTSGRIPILSLKILVLYLSYASQFLQYLREVLRIWNLSVSCLSHIFCLFFFWHIIQVGKVSLWMLVWSPSINLVAASCLLRPLETISSLEISGLAQRFSWSQPRSRNLSVFGGSYLFS